MTNYQLTYTQQIIISKQEYRRLGKLLEAKHNIVIIHDIDGNRHLIDWHYVTDNQVEIVRPLDLPEEK